MASQTYTVNFTYSTGDNATYLHSSLHAARDEKNASALDLYRQLLHDGQEPTLEVDTQDTTIIEYMENDERQTVAIAVSKIYA